ncbi:MAG: hypothetical protein K8S21_11170 [Gemmatimonadetes bacterium]|nr:hypothetical protein [Gemmatimonadota bacterium]
MSFPGVAETRPLLLYSGSRGGACRRFEPFVGDPDVLLEGVAYDPGCPAGIYVFARGASAAGLTVDPSEPGSELWLTSALTSKVLSIPLASPIRLPLHLWLVADETDVAQATALRDKLLDAAYPIMDAMGTGLTLDTISSVLGSGALAYDCASAAAIIGEPETYEQGRINVYFVKNYLQSDWTPAYNCVDVLHPEMIFISWGYDNIPKPTLAHEIGHSLGLVHPQTEDGPYGPVQIWGHTFEVDPFKSGNFMWTGPAITNASIGQLFALNFSSESWLNLDGSPFKRPQARPCQDDWGAGACAALNSFVPGGWPPP